MIKSLLVDIYRWIIPSGISIQNETKFANQRNMPTRAIFCRRNAKKNTTEK
jgi:hypothetical protein